MKRKTPASEMHLLGTSSQVAYEATKAAGQPYMDVRAGYRTDDNTIEFGGMAFQEGDGTPVTGLIPGSWSDFFNAQKAKPGRPRIKIEFEVAMWLSAKYFEHDTGCSIKQSRIRAAQRLVPGTNPSAAEQRYRRAAEHVLQSGALAEFDRLFELDPPDGKWIIAAHKAATVDVQADRAHLSGDFWMVKIGSAGADLTRLDCVITREAVLQ